MNRKDFIKISSVFAASAFMPFSNVLAAQTKLRVGLIGANGMGWSNLNALLKNTAVQCTALCDVDERVLDRRAAELAQRGIDVRTFESHQEMLAADLVDIVIIATPDHWHCLQLVDAVKAGKHVYIEKPIGNSVVECDVMVKAVENSSSIVQVGQWQRSQQHFRDAIDFVHSGKLGKIRNVKAWSYVDWKTPIQPKPDGPVPAGVNYDLWLGPAKKRPFNPNRFHFEFRWFWDYAGGLMTDWGVHMLDYALLGMKVSDPISVMAAGGKYADPNGASETPDTMRVVYEFDGFNVEWEQALGVGLGPYGRNHGVAFIGNNGTLVLNRNGWEVIAEKDKMEALALQKPKDSGLDVHMQNFVQAIQHKDATMLHAPIQVGAHIAVFSQLGNIAYRTGEKLYWNPSKRNFTNRKANDYLLAKYYNGYKIPKV